MKKIILSLALALSSYCAFAQNTFPSTGNVGIGTSTPADLLHIVAGANRKGITISSDGDYDAYTDIGFAISNISAIPSGTPKAWYISHRKDGYFSNTPIGQSSLEFYALLQSGYYAPLSFKSNGDVILVSTKNASGGNVGIGTTSPSQTLDVNGNINTSRNISLGNIGSPSAFNNAYYVYNSGNCYGLDLGYNTSSLRFNTRLFTPTSADIVFSSIATNTTPTTQNQFNQLLTIRGDNGNVLIGKVSQTNISYKLDINGSARANEIVVNSTGADFVFDKKYKLPKLSEVETYINENHHLPEMPSAEVMKANGLELGEMNKKLLQKVEELTLYLIDQSQQITELKRQVENLTKLSSLK